MNHIQLYDTLIRVARSLCWQALQLFSLLYLAGLLLGLLPLWRDSTDPPWPYRSGLSIRTDAATGCEYLETSGGAITPRMDASGHQRGCKPEEAGE